VKVRCHLRGIRGDRSLTMIVDELPPGTGLSKGLLSLLERGRWFCTDAQRVELEIAYGARAERWYDPELLLLLQLDQQAPEQETPVP
jgi:hypothetical protein